MVAAVLLINVLDDFFASIMLDVEIDVRRLRPLLGDETFKQEVHLSWIDGRDAKAVTNHRIGRRAPSLAKDPFFAAKFHDLAHGQEVTWIIQRLDNLKFFLHLIRDVRRYPVAVALTALSKVRCRSQSADVVPSGMCSEG